MGFFHPSQLEVEPEELMEELFAYVLCVLFKHGLSRSILFQHSRNVFPLVILLELWIRVCPMIEKYYNLSQICPLHPPLPPQCGRPLNTTTNPVHPSTNHFSSYHGLCPGIHHLFSWNIMKAMYVVSPNVVCLLPNC